MWIMELDEEIEHPLELSYLSMVSFYLKGQLVHNGWLTYTSVTDIWKFCSNIYCLRLAQCSKTLPSHIMQVLQ